MHGARAGCASTRRRVYAALLGISGGFTVQTFLHFFVDVEATSSPFGVGVHLLNVGLAIALVLASPYWSTTYLLGWLFGLIVLLNEGLVDSFDVILFVVPLVILALRLLQKI